MGLSALALYMKSLGHEVSGSDLLFSSTLSMLEKEGIRVYVGSKSIRNVDLVVRSSAVGEDDAEVISARKNGVEIMERMDFFSRFIKPTVGVTGTDGKSSTTCMIAWIATQCGLNPTLICGAFSLENDSNFKKGGEILVAEVDESDPKMGEVKTKIAVLTNLRYDHLERYSNGKKDQYLAVKAFLRNADFKVVPNGFECEGALTFGRDGDISYEVSKSDFEEQKFVMRYRGKEVHGTLPIAGIHQVENAAAAVGAAVSMGIDFKIAVKALTKFPGLHRRLEILRRTPFVVSDYAHTPCEIEAALNAVLPYFKDVVVFFEPHRYTRFHREFENFLKVISKAPRVIVTDVFEAFENFDTDVSPKEFVEELEKRGVKAEFCERKEVFKMAKKLNGAAYLFLGAGKADEMARKFMESLEVENG